MRVALYVRVSTTGQVEAQTIEQQIERLQAHVESEGWLLSAEHLYRDDGYSGANLNRPGLDCLRDRAAFAEFDVVLVTEPDRLSRNYVHQMLLLEELTQHGIKVEFLDRPMSDDPHDRLLLQIRGAVAEYERTLITDRMRRGRLRKLRAGQLLPWPIPPYSYRTAPENPRDPKGIRLDETEAAIVAEIFAWYLEPGGTLGLVAKRLNDLGVPTAKGKSKWHTSTVSQMLRNPIYMGMTYANRFRSVPSQRRRSALAPVGQGKSLKLRPESILIPVPMPAVVTAEVFAQAQEKLKQNQLTASRNNKAHDYLLRGRVSCGHCRLSADAKTLKGKYHYYICQGRHVRIRTVREQGCPARFIPATQLDELVWQDLCQVLMQPAMIAQALERAHGGHWLPQELQARIRNLKQAIRQLARQQQRLLDAYLAEVVQLPEFERKQQELQQKQIALEQQLEQLKISAEQRKALMELFPLIENFCQQVQPILQEATFAQRRQLIELLIDRVIVTDDEVEIRYVIPTHPDGPQIPFIHLRTNYRCGFYTARALLLADLAVTKSHARPRVSNDNPYSEAQFKTLKYRPDYPDHFGSLQDARQWARGVFHWYNHEHRHSSLGLMTPATVHDGKAMELTAKRQAILLNAYRSHPERFVQGAPTAPRLSEAVWINPPASQSPSYIHQDTDSEAIPAIPSRPFQRTG